MKLINSIYFKTKIFAVLIFINIFLNPSLTTSNKSFLKNKNILSNKQVVITNYRDTKSGKVVLACTECQKTIHKYITSCVNQEATGAQVDTIRAFCETLRLPEKDPPVKDTYGKYDLCMMIFDKLAEETGEPNADLIDPTKNPALCMKYKNRKIY
jgi:hypothetical protein